MIYNITTKDFKLSDKELNYIERYIQKVTNYLSVPDSDLPLIDLIIRKYKEKRLDHGDELISEDPKVLIIDVYPKFKTPIYYEGRILLRIPKKPLVVNFCGGTVEEAVDIAFERIFKELEKYEGKHIQSDSDYYDHESIRKKEESK